MSCSNFEIGSSCVIIKKLLQFVLPVHLHFKGVSLYLEVLSPLRSSLVICLLDADYTLFKTLLIMNFMKIVGYRLPLWKVQKYFTAITFGYFKTD